MQIFNPDSKIPFLSMRKYSAVLAIVLALAAVFMIVGKGLNYGLDFTGGVLVEVSYEKTIDTSDVRQALAKADFDNALVQSVGGTRDVVVRIQPKDMSGNQDNGQQADRIAGQVLAALKAQRGDVSLKRHDFVGPQIGAQLRNDGIVAVVFVTIGIMLYLAIRFERRFAIAVLVTEVHDTLVMVGIISLVGREFDMTVLASVLAVIGYSVNDTVVVFDRVRELFRMARKAEPEEVLNRAINNTLSRTIITSLTTAITMGALYVWGGPAVKGFAVTMLIGIVLGTLSSIFISCPLLLWLGVSKHDLMPVKRDNPELARRP
ncbi:MAG: protein translocase subunit SecF [Rhodanobacteraceae bacterium]